VPDMAANGDSEDNGLGANFTRRPPDDDAPDEGAEADARTHAQEVEVQLAPTVDVLVLDKNLPNHALQSGVAASTRTLARVEALRGELDLPESWVDAHSLMGTKNGTVFGLVALRHSDPPTDAERAALDRLHVFDTACKPNMRMGARWPVEGGLPLCKMLNELRKFCSASVFIDVEAERYDPVRLEGKVLVKTEYTDVELARKMYEYGQTEAGRSVKLTTIKCETSAEVDASVDDQILASKLFFCGSAKGVARDQYTVDSTCIRVPIFVKGVDEGYIMSPGDVGSKIVARALGARGLGPARNIGRRADWQVMKTAVFYPIHDGAAGRAKLNEMIGMCKDARISVDAGDVALKFQVFRDEESAVASVVKDMPGGGGGDGSLR
jgi:hypothetical protein